MAETQLLYFENTYQFSSEAHVLDVQTIDGKTTLILNQTIFYPQGGGQPSDLGTIENANGKFVVSMVKKVGELVHHYGQFEKGRFSIGENVKLQIDEARRRLSARLHSAGHVIDVAMEKIGIKLEATKGYHFPDGPYDEYNGEIPLEKIDSVKIELEKTVKEMIQAGFVVKKQFAPKERMMELCGFIPDYLPDGKPARVITVYGERGCPCGGTHVENVNQLGTITISKITSKKGITRVSYRLE